jgi:hypothetical protein
MRLLQGPADADGIIDEGSQDAAAEVLLQAASGVLRSWHWLMIGWLACDCILRPPWPLLTAVARLLHKTATGSAGRGDGLGANYAWLEVCQFSRQAAVR